MKKQEDVLKILRLAEKAIKSHNEENVLPNNAYFVNKDTIAVLSNPKGNMRYPYSFDGMTLWAYSSGYITLNESSFFVFPQTLEGRESNIAFFGGIKNKNGYDYFSITGVNDTTFGLTKDRITIFTPTYTLYIRKISRIVFYVKVGLSVNKEMLIDVGLINTSDKEKEVYLSSYLNPILIHSNYESEESKWFKQSKIFDNYTLLSTKEDVSRQIHLFNYALLRSNNPYQHQKTSLRMEYVGDKNASINGSINLLKGEICEADKGTFIDSAIYGDLTKIKINAKERINIAYNLSISKNVEPTYTKYESNDNDYLSLSKLDKKLFNSSNMLKIKFGDFDNGKINPELLNKFLHSVIRQVNYCSNAKNSSLSLLGVRDVAQMAEASLMWDKKSARKIILKILNYVDISGRCPRQFSSPNASGEMLMDNREFIDQGQWVISLLYKYLCYTNDYSILKEKCSYIKLIERKKAILTKESGTVLEHIFKITDYLISNIDPTSNCLKTLYGDWNDAVDGLGSSDNPNERFGNGVSAMASLHLYRNLKEISEICSQIGCANPQYLEIRERLGNGILQNLVVTKNGEKRIIHGYGNNKSFYVGSFDDIDHQDRLSATSNAFYVLSDLYKLDSSLVPYVVSSFKKLDSKYGIKTFDKYFDSSNASEVGRIVNLPKGTAENSATYIHASMFSLKALAILNESNFVFDQLYKLIPLTHESISVSSFVMPNSYGHNEALGIDGQSMNDWYTGSSNTLLKLIVDDIFGVHPQINSKVYIRPMKNICSKELSLSVSLKNKILHIDYKNNNSDNREIVCDGNKTVSDSLLLDFNKMDQKEIFIEVID